MPRSPITDEVREHTELSNEVVTPFALFMVIAFIAQIYLSFRLQSELAPVIDIVGLVLLSIVAYSYPSGLIKRRSSSSMRTVHPYLMIPFYASLWLFFSLVNFYMTVAIVYVFGIISELGSIEPVGQIASTTPLLSLTGIVIAILVMLLSGLVSLAIRGNIRSKLFILPAVGIIISVLHLLSSNATEINQMVLELYTGLEGTPLGGVALLGSILFKTMYIWIPVSLVLGGSYLFLWWCDNYLDDLRRSQSPPFASQKTQFLRAGGYLLTTGIIGFGSILAFASVLSGIPETKPITAWVFGSFPEMLQLMEESYETADYLFSEVPLFPARVYSLSFFTVLLVPVFFFTGGWIYNIGSEIRWKNSLLRRAECSAQDSDVVSSGITVLRLDLEGTPAIHPVSRFFGLKKFIVISQVVEEILTDEERDAVLAHEMYHINHWDLKITTVVSVFPFLLGGRNAVLSFYDYPKIERQADKYAAEMVGSQPLIDALKKTDLLQERARKASGGSLRNVYPGFVDFQLVDKPGKSLPFIEELLSKLSSTYHLFFGSVLLETAHQGVDERIETIRQEI